MSKNCVDVFLLLTTRAWTARNIAHNGKYESIQKGWGGEKDCEIPGYSHNIQYSHQNLMDAGQEDKIIAWMYEGEMEGVHENHRQRRRQRSVRPLGAPRHLHPADTNDEWGKIRVFVRPCSWQRGTEHSVRSSFYIPVNLPSPRRTKPEEGRGV